MREKKKKKIQTPCLDGIRLRLQELLCDFISILLLLSREDVTEQTE